MGRLGVKLKERAERDLKASVISSSMDHLKGSPESMVNTKGTAHRPPCWIKRSSNLKLHQGHHRTAPKQEACSPYNWFTFGLAHSFMSFGPAVISSLPWDQKALFICTFLWPYMASPHLKDSPPQKLITPLTFSYLSERRKPSQQDGAVDKQLLCGPERQGAQWKEGDGFGKRERETGLILFLH